MSRPAFQEAQYAFAAHIRDPAHNAAPEGIEDRRLNIYRELFFNNVAGLMAQTFPVLNQILSDEKWLRTLRDFYAHHHCHTPLFTELAKEFLDWMTGARKPEADDPAFLLELAHYEWVELALSLAADIKLDQETHRYGDLLNAAPILSPLAWSLSYRFPVHKISPDYQPAATDFADGESATHLLVYRNREDDIGFIETNIVTLRLLALLANNIEAKQTGQALLEQLADQLPNIPRDAMVTGGLQTLEQLRQKDIVLGTLA